MIISVKKDERKLRRIDSFGHFSGQSYNMFIYSVIIYIIYSDSWYSGVRNSTFRWHIRSIFNDSIVTYFEFIST